MNSLLDTIPIGLLKVCGGILDGLAFGPIIVFVVLVVFNIEMNFIALMASICGFLFGFYIGYRQPKKTITQVVSVVSLIALIGLTRRFLF